MLSYFLGLIFCLLALGLSVDAQNTRSSFSCDGRATGYYADVGAGCQVYHMCDGLGRKFSFVCPNATLFQQRMLICDHWFMVNCSRSESEYDTNLLIGQKEKPFVDDSGQSSFQRTPRPDYGTKEQEKNFAINNNKVDVPEESVSTAADRSDQKLFDVTNPSRKRNESPVIVPKTTSLPPNKSVTSKETTPVVNFGSRFKATTPVYPTFVDEALKLGGLDLAPPKAPKKVSTNTLQNTQTSKQISVNFQSNFKGTTPVYPNYVDDSQKYLDSNLLPPIRQNNTIESSNQNSQVKFESNFKATTPVYPSSVDDTLKTKFDVEIALPMEPNREEPNKVNFISQFEATTPDYPNDVEPTSPNPYDVGILPPFNDPIKRISEPEETATSNPINFESNFLATVPNYPTSVEPTSPSPNDVGLLPPFKNDQAGRFLKFQPIDDVRKSGQEEPSQYYEPPLSDTGYVDPNGALVNYQPNTKHLLSPRIEDWEKLRENLAVPNFEFPIDSHIRRASYESDFTSFQPRPSGFQNT